MPETHPAAFISYCRDDQDFALRLAQDLKAAGAAVWLDQLDIKPGSSWDNAVEDALLAANQLDLAQAKRYYEKSCNLDSRNDCEWLKTDTRFQPNRQP